MQAANTSLTGGSGSGTLPTGSPWTNLTTIRWQARIHGAWTYGSNQVIEGSNAFSLRILTSGITLTSWGHGSQACNVTPTAGSDVIIIAQQDATNNVLQMWAVDPQTGLIVAGPNNCGIPAGTSNDSGSGVIVGALAAGSISYVRVYSTLTNTSNPPGNRYDADLLDYELENNGTDTAGHATLTMSGATFGATPLYSPAAVLNPWPTINTIQLPFGGGSGSIAMNASQSFTATDNATLTYLHSQASGPATGTFTNPANAIATFTTSVSTVCLSSCVDYVLQVQVTANDGTSASTTQVNVGAVSKNADGTVNTGLSAGQNRILGPLLPMGPNDPTPWIYYSLAKYATAQQMAAAATSHPPVFGALLCTGTTTASGSQPINLAGSGTNYSACLTNGQLMFLNWNAPEGSATGHHWDNVSSITNNTTASLQGSSGAINSTWGSGLQMYALPATTSTLNISWWTTMSGEGNFFWFFYDFPISLYRLYFATGQNQFLSYARQMSGYGYDWFIDQGYSIPVGHSWIPNSLYFSATDGHPERFAGLYTLIQYVVNNNFEFPYFSGADTRELAYPYWALALGAETDPDATHHSFYCSTLSGTNGVQKWISAQTAGGWWPENVFGGNPGFVYAWGNWPTYPNKIYGASPWRMGIAAKALQADYDVLADTSAAGCNNPTLAASLLTTLNSAVSFMYNYGYDNFTGGTSQRGIFYAVNYASEGLNTCGQILPTCQGLASIAIGSNTVTLGAGGNAQSVTGCAPACSTTYYIGFQNAGADSIYKVVSCASQTQCTVTPNYGSFGEGSNLVSQPWYAAPAMSTTCGGSLASSCTAPGSRDLDRLVIGPTAWQFHTTGNSAFKTMANEWMSASWGGPSVGPNSSTNPGNFDTGQACAGPGCDGFITGSITPLRGCSTNVPPCVPGGDNFNGTWKNLSESIGAPDSDAIAWTIIGCSLSPTSVPGGTVGVSYSSGVTASGCSASTYTLSSGSLPPGLNLNPATGAITGTPTTPGVYAFTIAYSTATDPLSITIAASGCSLSPMVLPGGTVGTAYSSGVTASGCSASTYTVSVGSLPPGLTLNPATGAITGTPTTAGTYPFTIAYSTATDPLSIGIAASGSGTVSIGLSIAVGSTVSK